MNTLAQVDPLSQVRVKGVYTYRMHRDPQTLSLCGGCVWCAANALKCQAVCTILSVCPSVCLSVCLSVGIDFKIRTVEIDNKKIKLQIW